MENSVRQACALLMFEQAVPRLPHTGAVQGIGQAACRALELPKPSGHM